MEIIFMEIIFMEINELVTKEDGAGWILQKFVL
jgi:hypothetical protein